MATNAEQEEVDTSTEVNTSTVEDELKQAKQELSTAPEEPAAEPSDETEEPEQIEPPAEGEEEEAKAPDSEPTFTKLVTSIGGDTLEEHYALVAKAYGESTKEALRLKKENDSLKTTPGAADDDEVITPERLYIQQKQKEEIDSAFADIQKDFPIVNDPANYQKFTSMAESLLKTIMDAEKRLAPPKELYAKSVVLLGWTADDNKDRLNAALKNSASETRISSGTPKTPAKTKVSEAVISTNMKMYPNKSRADIIKELEPYIQ